MKQFFKILKQNSMAGAKLRFMAKVKMFAFAVLIMAGVAWVATDAKSAMVTMAALPVIALVKKDSGLTKEENDFLGNIEKALNKAFEEYSGDLITKEAYETELKEVRESISKAIRDSGDGKITKDLGELQETIKNISKEIQKMKDNGITLGAGSELEKALDAMLDNPKFKDFVDGHQKSSGKIEMKLKDIVSIANNYTGSHLISQQNSRIVEPLAERRVNLRDIMNTEQGDPAYPSITYTEIESLDRGAATVTENGRLPKSSFKLKESSENVKRIGTYLQLSKRLLKSRVYVKSWLLNRLPKWIKMAEDFQIMFGDNQGENLNGIARQAVCVSTWLKDNVCTGAANSIKLVSSFNEGKQVKIEFFEAFDKIAEGMKIVISGAPKIGEDANPLNASHLLHKVSDRVIVIDLAYAGVLTAEQIAMMSFTVKNNFFNEVVSPDLGDAVKAIFSILTYAEYSPNVIVLNPSTIFEIETAKDTTGRSLGLVSVGVNGVKTIAGRPVVESTAIAPGFYFAGDMAMAASLIDYSSLTVEFAEDVECKISGYVVVIAQEEVIMPVYNKFAFAYGKLSDVKVAITKA